MVTEEAEQRNELQAYALLGSEGDLLSGLGLNDARTRIQELLSQWLQMENVVVLLGAGASVSRGGPVMSELEGDVLSQLSGLSEAWTPAKQFEPVLRQRLSESAEHGSAFGFERWLSILSNVAAAAGGDGTPIDKIVLRGSEGGVDLDREILAAAIEAIGHLIALRCSLHLPTLDTGAEPSGHHAFVAKMVARDPTLGRTHLFTTNYDTLVEQALDGLGVGYSDGFIGTISRHFDPSGYGLDVYYPGEVSEGRVRRFDKFMHLYKLHGSVHWRRGQRGEVFQAQRSAPATWAEWTDMAPESKAQWLGKNGEQAVAVLPTDGKYVSTLGMPYAHLFRAFQQRMEVPQTFLVVVGYGFGDDHINALIDDGMANPSTVVLVVDPCGADQVVDRVRKYQQAGDRAFLLHSPASGDGGPPKHATFDDFALTLMPNVRWLGDFLRLRRMEADLRDPVPDASEDDA